MNKVVLTNIIGSVGFITVSRPRERNALNGLVLEGLSSALADFTGNPNVRVIVLRGQGQHAFISGADINEFVSASIADALDIARRIRLVTDAMSACPKPVVASVHGYCLGGGLELALAADIRIAASNAKFGLPEIKLGIIPGGGGTVRLTKLVGQSVASQLAMTGDPIDAEHAYRIGLLAAVHPGEQLEHETMAYANRLAKYPPFAFARLKSTLALAADVDTKHGLDAETLAFALCYSTKDKEEGARAFLEKRPAVFTGN